MDYAFTPEQTAAIAWAKAFAEKEIRPVAAELDQKGAFDAGLMQKIAQAGFMGVSIQKQYGGRGDGLFVRSLIAEEFAKESLATGINYTIGHGGLCVLKNFGSEAQKAKYIPDMVTGKILGTFAFTEEEAGSDPGGAKTVAVREGDSYVINGKKAQITHGAKAQLHVLFALTNPAMGVRGMSAFLVPADTPGVTVGKVYDMMGARSCELAEVCFDHARVPADSLLGTEGGGYKAAMQAINEGKVNVAFLALGLAERALAESVRHMKERRQFGRPLSDNQGLQWYIADMVTEIEAARLLSHQSVLAAEAEDPRFGYLVAMAKYCASETAFRVAGQALQLFGGYGVYGDEVVQRLYRDVQVLRIYDGTSEVQKMIIAKQALR
jgi:alkylation response protein AidB-like acyl-CoA dehydrogenase